MATFVLTRWDLKTIERDLVSQGLTPLTDFYFSHSDEDPLGWLIGFVDNEIALLWRLQHGDKWL